MHNLTQSIYNHATEVLGFDDCRFTDPFVDEYLDEYREWLKKGRQGDMDYLARHLPFKEDPRKLLEGVRSAIVLIKNYKNTSHKHLSQKLKVSRYAVGRDYHLVISEKLKNLTEYITTIKPGAHCYHGVDSRPLADRSLALKAGMGFRGKNTMVIKPGMGSYFFIGIVLTDLVLTYDQPLKWDCGSCRLCLDACPTGALANNFKLDAVKCISYQTIEQKTPMSTKQLKVADGWIFGCDICQEVCPYNREKTPLTDWVAFHPESGVGFEGLDRADIEIPKDSAMYRSRKRLVANLGTATTFFSKKK